MDVTKVATTMATTTLVVATLVAITIATLLWPSVGVKPNTWKK